MAKDDKITPADWMNNIKLGKKFRKDYGGSDRWKLYSRYYRNDFEEGSVPLNMIFSMARSIVPRIYFRNPRVTVTPTQPGMWWHAKVLERIDNWIIREINIKKQLKRIVLDAFLFGTGVVKLGFDSEFGFSREDWSESGGYISDAREEDNLLEYDTNVKPGMPWVKRLSPKLFVVPWGTEDIDDAPWVAHMFVRKLEDVKADPLYKNTKDLKATLRYKPTVHDDSEIRTLIDDENAREEYVELWEIHDVKRGRVYVVAADHDKFLRDVPDDLAIEGLPFEVLVFNSDPDFFWGVADPKIIEPQQIELNHARRMQALHERLAAVRMLAREGNIDHDEIAKLTDMDSDPVPVVFVKGSLGDSVMPFSIHTPQDYSLYVRELRQDIREQIGFSRNQMGEFDMSSRRTATEAAIVEQAAGIRVDERRDAVADLFEAVIRKINQMIFSFWDSERAANIVGPDGRTYWVSFTGDQITGEYNYKVDPESSLPVTNETKKREIMEVFSALSPIQGVNIEGLIRMLLSQYEWADADMVLAPSPATPGAFMEQAVPLGDFINQAQQIGGM